MPRVLTELMIGKKYGRLTVLKIDHWKKTKSGRRAYVLCKCDCGNEKVICAYSLTNGLTKSCGCLNKEVTGNNFRKHGLSNTRICHIWRDMHRRCEKTNRKAYRLYGEKGISVCDEWSGEKGLLNFVEWSKSNGYSDELTIDRIDGNKGYSPDNCRWADYETQANNISTNRWIECNGERHTIAQWSRITGLSQSKIKHRLYSGWNEEQALGLKEHKTRYASEVLYTINGETHNVREWCRIRGLSIETVRYRREHNWEPEEIFGFKEHINERRNTN